MSRFLSPTLAAVTPYTPGEQPQDQQYIKLNTNESPYLPSPAVIAAVSEHEVEKLRLYSDPACADLLKAAAAHFGLQPEQIMPGNGSDENLFFALRAFCDADHPLAYDAITYGCYGVWCGLIHIPSHIIPLKEDFTLDPKDYYGLNQTIVLANPNAPTGIALPRAEIEGILKANPNNVVIVDEAYVDFGGESCVPLIDQYENLLVVQTFSKSRQLAGARLGLAMGNAKLIADLNRVKFSLNPYNINRLTLKAGQAALEDTAYFDRTRAAIVDTRAWTKQQLEQRGFAVLDSRSNFLFASTDRKDGETLYKELKKNGILVRHFDAPRIQNWLRITIGTPEQMQTFMETLDKIMEERTMPNRMISLERNTNETQIDLTLDLDGTGRYEVDTGCGFLNHMLELFARHGRFDLVLTCHGDVQVDYHHTTEDVGIALGQAFARALGDMRGIQRYGSFYLPMDEALILCAVDLSGRCTLNWDVRCSTEKVGDFDVECAKEFWLGFARSVPATIHFVQFAGENTHHILEACFKGAGHALGAAVKIDEAHKDEIPSTKGLLV